MFLFGVPACIIMMLAIRMRLRNNSSSDSGGLLDSRAMQKLLWFYGLYAMLWYAVS